MNNPKLRTRRHNVVIVPGSALTMIRNSQSLVTVVMSTHTKLVFLARCLRKLISKAKNNDHFIRHVNEVTTIKHTKINSNWVAHFLYQLFCLCVSIRMRSVSTSDVIAIDNTFYCALIHRTH